jgi:5'-3' exonuclease
MHTFWNFILFSVCGFLAIWGIKGILFDNITEILKEGVKTLKEIENRFDSIYVPDNSESLESIHHELQKHSKLLYKVELPIAIERNLIMSPPAEDLPLWMSYNFVDKENRKLFIARFSSTFNSL